MPATKYHALALVMHAVLWYGIASYKSGFCASDRMCEGNLLLSDSKIWASFQTENRELPLLGSCLILSQITGSVLAVQKCSICPNFQS